MRYRLERLRRRGDTATFSSNASSLRPLPGAAQLVALHRRITDAGALEDGEYLWKQTIRSAGRAAADTDMQSAAVRLAVPHRPWFQLICAVGAISNVSAAGVDAGAAAAPVHKSGRFMCRWIAYRGENIALEHYVTSQSHSLIAQSLHAPGG
jgi:hypothetical protein